MVGDSFSGEVICEITYRASITQWRVRDDWKGAEVADQLVRVMREDWLRNKPRDGIDVDVELEEGGGS